MVARPRGVRVARIEVSAGELCDRIAILVIKTQRIRDPGARDRAARLLGELEASWRDAGLPPGPSLPEWGRLLAVNGALWDVEDELRAHEARGDFGAAFVERARSVYALNDERARLKASVDASAGDDRTEPKWFTSPTGNDRPGPLHGVRNVADPEDSR